MRKIVAIALLCCLLLPAFLAAEPRTTTRAPAPSVTEAFTTWVHVLWVLVAQTMIPLSKDGPAADGGCAVDPDGRCGH
jgi:hypothetical protein